MNLRIWIKHPVKSRRQSSGSTLRAGFERRLGARETGYMDDTVRVVKHLAHDLRVRREQHQQREQPQQKEQQEQLIPFTREQTFQVNDNKAATDAADALLSFIKLLRICAQVNQRISRKFRAHKPLRCL